VLSINCYNWLHHRQTLFSLWYIFRVLLSNGEVFRYHYTISISSVSVLYPVTFLGTRDGLFLVFIEKIISVLSLPIKVSLTFQLNSVATSKPHRCEVNPGTDFRECRFRLRSISAFPLAFLREESQSVAQAFKSPTIMTFWSSNI